MPVDFRCPYCGRELSAPDESAGTTGTCRFCGATLVAPAASGVPAELLQAGDPDTVLPAGPDVREPTGFLDPNEVLRETWRLFWRYPGVMLVSHGIALGVYLLVLAPLIGSQWGKIWEAAVSGQTPELPASFQALSVLIDFLMAPMLAGPLYVVDKLVARGEVDLGAVFSGYRNARSILAFSILYAVPRFAFGAILGVASQLAPAVGAILVPAALALSIFMWLALRLGLMEIVDRGASPILAMSISWQTTRPHLPALFATWVMLCFLMLSGLVACCFGVAITFLMFRTIGEVLIYRRLRGLQGGSQGE